MNTWPQILSQHLTACVHLTLARIKDGNDEMHGCKEEDKNSPADRVVWKVEGEKKLRMRGEKKHKRGGKKKWRKQRREL